MRAPEWRLLWLFVLPVVVWGRIVRVPSSPLLRVEGTDIAIPCNVTNYEGPPEQNFDWMYSSGAGPGLELVSTWDDGFTKPVFLDRVKAGEISLQRVSNDEVLLLIKQLKPSDEGNYTCSTPSTDATFSGNYEAHVQLKVISDTLRLIGPKGRLTNVRNVTEGGSFQLQCQAAASGSSAHTHLSLTWERQTGGSTSEVLTLTHLGRFQPGAEYAERYGNGEVRLDTSGSDLYQLTVEGAHPQDSGQYSCVARTWVQGADGWDKIQEKKVAVAQVEVHPLDLTVTVPETTVEVPEGSPLTLTCQLAVDGDVPVTFQVRWFWSHSGEVQELPGGPGPEPAQQKMQTHQLALPQARDSGDYTCQGTAWTLLRNGSWSKAAEKMSAPIKVNVLSNVPALQVSLNTSVAPLMSDDPTELLCHVTVSGAPRLSVSWYFTSLPGPHPSAGTSVLVGSMNQDWSLQVGERYEQRLERGDLIFSRRDPNTFSLRLQWTSEEDRGSYHCEGTAWKLQADNSWAAVSKASSEPITVSWAAEDSALVVNAKLIKTVSAAGGTFEMMCTVQPKNIPFPQYSVQVTLRPPESAAAPVNVISVSRDGATRRKPSSVTNTFLEKGKEGVYIFRLYQVQNQDVGAYQCVITAWTQGGGGAWHMVRNQTTNPIQLEFRSSGPVFNVTARSDSTSVYHGDRAEFWCFITIDGPALDPKDMAFDVAWFAQRPGGSTVFLAEVDHTGQVQHGRRNSTSEVALERVSDMEYRLRVYNSEEEDAGGHYCTVTPWVRTGEGDWNSQESITSSLVALSVKKDLLSAFQYPLLIGSGVALLVGLLSLLIGYCSSRYCCKAQPVPEKRREHRRLMSMEMD
ncbi:prostaglandin F2 receptor negative regulator [Hyperolius riggenbachi]|uniref:prostaglandin F2 receptor negative regulator n=1 Tax=Hyperolius riggenbachi TaxID=752182 RepID=UPI0035A288AE